MAKLSFALALWATVAQCSATVAARYPGSSSNTTNVGCSVLAKEFPDKVFFPGSAVYGYENQEFWSNNELLSPSCIFRPNASSQVSAAIVTSRLTHSKFAVRGGGHMAIKGSNNIDNGILMVMSNLSTLAISADKKSVDIGPAYRWIDVYNYLTGFNVTVGGGRLGPVGVPGLLLAGGVNFLGNQHGWSADNVLEYEIVLADGAIVNASATQNEDLFWALKGGSSNFGIVTKFTQRTFPSTQVWAGTYIVGPAYSEQFLEAVANFSAFNTDPKSHAVPMSLPVGGNATAGIVILFYDSPTISNPPCFEPFLQLPAASSTLGFKTVAEFAQELGGLVTPHINDMFIAGTVVGKDYESLLKGVQITNDVFLSAIPALHAVVPASTFNILEITWQPLGPMWQAGSKAANPKGNPLGFDPDTKGTYLCFAQVVEWKDNQYDDLVIAWAQNTTAAITAATKAAGLHDSFTYMGDAAGFNSIFEGYGAANQQKLLDVSRKYDPQRLFQDLLPGGWKIGS